MRTLFLFYLLANFFLTHPAMASANEGPETFVLTLSEVQQEARQNSNSLQAAQYILQAAKAGAMTTSSSLYPRADLNGNYFYQTHVPTQTSAGSTIKMGDNENYSIGPIISHTLFDGGKTINSSKSARLNAEAKEQSLLSQERDLDYSVRLTYARVQLAATNLSLTIDALKLAQDQNADIDLRLKVGTVSRLDQISAHKEMLNYKILFYQAQNNLSCALQDLSALIGTNRTYNTARPLPLGREKELPKDIPGATLLISIETLETLSASLTSQQDHILPPGEETPHIKSLSLSARSSEAASRSQRGAQWPKLSLAAESRTAYPDASRQEQYNNNIFSVSVSLPVWDWNQTRGLAEKYLNEARAEEKRKAQKLSDMAHDHTKASDTLSNLKEQRLISQHASREAEEIARLTYQSYTAGKSTFLEVQNANLKAMQANVDTAKLEFEIINNISKIIYLAGSQDR